MTPSTAPVTSTLGRVPARVEDGTAVEISHRQPSTSGRLITKIQRHEPTFRSPPAINGPSAPAIVPHAVHVPIAGPRSCWGKVATINASELGVSSAPAIPWSARKATSSSIEGAIAHKSDATPKPPTPSAKMRRSPKMSPREPPSRINEPSVSR